MSHLITKTGLEELKLELKKLVEVLIPDTLVSLEKAKDSGDVSENSALDAAKEDLDRYKIRQQEIEDVLKDYQIIDESSIDKSKVQIGNFVKVVYLDDNEEYEVKIVGGSEASILDFKISNESPLAKAVLGKKRGEVVKVRLKKGFVDVKVVEIK